MDAKWIWLNDGMQTENERACFADEFTAPENAQSCELSICAVTKYALYLNGRLVGRGPARSDKGICYVDAYQLAPLLRRGKNYLAIHVWSYGWSTYQSICDDGGLIYEITANGALLCRSDSSTRACRDAGHMPFSPKRNVNLGFADYYDARAFSSDWLKDAALTEGWPRAKEVTANRKLLPRPIRQYHVCEKYPERVLRVQDVAQSCQALSINTRRAFFADRRDADESIINGFIGLVIKAPEKMSGRISFPNRSWNGLLGSFRVGESVYPVADRARDVEVVLPEGEALMLIQLNGKFDDLYCHIEFRFPRDVEFIGLGTDRCCFVIGPTGQLKCDISGLGDIYDFMSEPAEPDKKYFACSSVERLERAGAKLKWVESRYVMPDAYLLSLARLAQVKREYAVTERHLGMLWQNDCCTVVDLPLCGDYRRLLVDFGDVCVGNLSFCVNAPEGAIIDIYGFENMYRGEIDFTIGLNNGARYICREGWQEYSCMARMGLRYAIISIHGNTRPVRIRDFHIASSVYSSPNSGSFACNDEKLNAIWNMCRRTHELCVEDSFTDSPTYEQAFWLGDAQTSAAVNAYVFGDYPFVRHNLLLAASARQNTPLFNALTPTDWGTSIPMWTMNWFISIVQYVESSGDRSIIPEIYDTAREMLLYYRSLLTGEGGFLVSAWNLIDWAALDVPALCVPTAYQGMLSFCAGKFAQMAGELKKSADEALFYEMAAITNRFLNDKLWNNERGAFYDGWSPERGFSTTHSIQTHTLLCLYGQIADPARRELSRGYILEKPADFADVGSPFMLYYVYEAWAAAGRRKEIFADIKQRWGEMLRYETTTCWEVFPGFYENSRTRSYCHSWSASPAALMQKYLLGIRREADGFKEISFDFPDTELRWCRGGIPTPFGLIYADWNKDIGEFLLRLPEEITLRGEPPKGFRVTVERTKLQ